MGEVQFARMIYAVRCAGWGTQVGAYTGADLTGATVFSGGNAYNEKCPICEKVLTMGTAGRCIAD